MTRPSRALCSQPLASSLPRLALLLGLAVLAPTAVGCGGFINEDKMAQLRASGAAAEATVVSIEPLGIVLNRTQHLLRLELDIPVPTDAGLVVTRVFTDYFVPSLAFPAIQPRSKLLVKYAPDNPSDVYIDFPAMGYRL